MIDWNNNGIIDPVDVGVAIALDSCNEANVIHLLNYEFAFVQELAPQKTILGKIKTYNPKDNYYKKDSTPLNKHGNGPFCKFSLADNGFWGISGVYALFDDNKLLYIGLTHNLTQRFNQGYGTIAPKNCYIGGQNTNCKINAMVLEKYINGGHVYLFFHKTSKYKSVEGELIRAYSPPYNGTTVADAQRRRYADNALESISEERYSAEENVSGFDALTRHLAEQDLAEIKLTFKEIESIIGRSLPHSAYYHPQWWSNSKTKSHAHSQSWQSVGYRTIGFSSSIREHEMRFVKI